MVMIYEQDTIAAIATPLGVGGVGIVRVSGSSSFDIVQKIFSNKKLVAGKIFHGWINDQSKLVDEVIVLPFKAPNSFTGDDVVEIQCHGGVNVIKKILEVVIASGARLAQRGEFTKRAFLNHKMDLSQAEAVLDLINAKTVNFAMKSANNLSGKLSVETKNIKDELFNLYSQIIAAVDFPEDVKEPEYTYIQNKVNECSEKISKILSFSKNSNIMRQGVKIAIVGRPNVGKSSLFNALLNLDRAIVTDIAGTTRDIIQESLDLGGINSTIIDTAGIRDSENIDKVEAIGIDYTKKCIDDSDIVLFLFDSNEGFLDEDAKIFELIESKPFIKIATKNDLKKPENADIFSISVKTGENIKTLQEKIYDLALDKNNTETEFITNQRQQECFRKTLNALQQALGAIKNEEIQDLISIDIKTALLHLSEISGEVITDDVLNNIFDNFCIGK